MFLKFEISTHFHFLFIPAKSITHDFQGLTREEEIYDLQWKVINDDMKNMLADATEVFTFFTYGKFCALLECFFLFLEMVRLINDTSSVHKLTKMLALVFAFFLGRGFIKLLYCKAL